MNIPKLASVYFAAERAAFEASPEESQKLITRHDELHRAWTDSRKWDTVPAELTEASAAMDADPFATVVMELRRKGNEVWRREHEAADGKAVEA